ncbi:MAG: pyroglutamyl-peptidase I [Lysobacterales bacterium 69-70]|nr:pyroglutamyl-peptidase I [Xanthomonadaceae bacterium]ODU33563.1 MAG: pyroglutamyl-peptidase I [Xanthomonadaceae bacterium SCN 69-320]ODV21993.1 MAG: pyroglutamyl-peptidase I [Xanthomonadaceae bacterium SCN 69-25]OJZ02896.1 MAG: pyroglutamyl-peptidase I [Xanthomonadales bacterium 69-70]
MNTPLPRVLLTGFDPFGGESLNPSWEAVRRLDGELVHGHHVVAEQLPTCFGTSLRRLRAALTRSKPALVVCVGQAGGRSRVSLERVAINVDDARIPDNAGKQPIDRAIVRGGPAAYFTSLPIKAQLAALQKAGLPAEISQTAGTFVCNHVFYGLMHALREKPQVRGGFVHIPFLPEQAVAHPGAPSLALDTIVTSLRLIVGTALTTRRDRRLGGGATH